ncbi:RagB/SusD family nutrient uptake outer membrane protein [uncultured Zobellia sp.]|uniref:RagB/SusD family nutrient uptake outer membrane protein n=1 Tax=uncultured Zobellia sp. TaxID=255433 RepID=UPI002591DE5C|nr:RagB/SusD family nutrient uptake outer membrane protein [uncultured Zobellia sp.]
MIPYRTINNGLKFCSLALIFALSSCSKDYLEVVPSGEPTIENFYKSPVDAEQALTAAYSPMREMYARENFGAANANDLVFGDIGTDDILKGGARVNDGPHLYEKEIYSLTTSNSAVEKLWQVNYKGVLYANLVLANVPSIEFEDEERKKDIIAEAHFLRAYYYFDLVNTFGGVPIIDTPLEPGEYNVARSSTEETYRFIEEDLKKAISELPSRFDNGAEFLGHADIGAALGLMMRVALYQNKMDQVKTYGEQLIELPYVLADYATIFEPSGEWNTGSIFEINFSSNSDKLGTLIPRMIGARKKGGVGFSQIKEDLRNEFEPNDPRFDASFYNVPGGYGTEWYIKKYSITPFSENPKPSVGGNGNSGNNIRILRLSDAYLMYAEAIYNTDPTTAINYVNKVRQRARGDNDASVVPDLDGSLNGQALLDAIYHERRVELAGEGFRYHDLIRTDRAEALLGPLGFKKGLHEIMPIPLSQIDLSQGVLVQNPGY